MNPMATLLLWCGYAEILIGLFLGLLLTASLYDADAFLTSFLGFPATSLGRLAGNSWAQAAVAFGMHAYADVANGWEQVQRLRSGKPLPKIATVWNSTRAFISFVFAVSVARGVAAEQGADFTHWPTGALVLMAVLAFDAILLRPAAVYCQRALEDSRPPAAKAELNEWRAFTPLQRVCRSVFYYEAVLSGTSGIAYLLAPELFPWLFGFAPGDANSTMLFGLSVFGGCVSAFGLYQMSADIDTRTGHVAWWLFLDFVWLYIFWQGVTVAFDGKPWNPFTWTGASFFCHLAFHADSTLALARTIFLYTVWTRGRGGKANAGVAGAPAQAQAEEVVKKVGSAKKSPAGRGSSAGKSKQK